MYNKLFTKILDSSIWLEPASTRIVWITLLAAMDQDGYAHFSAIENLASRARVTLEECNAAVTALTSPDQNSADPDNDGRRVERVPGGFMVLNAVKYQEVVNSITRREQTRLRVKKFREKQSVTQCNEVKQNVTHPYEYENEHKSEIKKGSAEGVLTDVKSVKTCKPLLVTEPIIEEIYQAYPLKVGKKDAIKAIRKALTEIEACDLLTKTLSFARARGSDLDFCPHPATWFNRGSYNDDPSTWKRHQPISNYANQRIQRTKPDYSTGKF